MTTSETSDTAVPSLDGEQADRLVAWMDTEGLPGGDQPLETRYISGGSQNEIYELCRGDLHCAMRIPPSTAPADPARSRRGTPLPVRAQSSAAP